MPPLTTSLQLHPRLSLNFRSIYSIGKVLLWLILISHHHNCLSTLYLGTWLPDLFCYISLFKLYQLPRFCEYRGNLATVALLNYIQDNLGWGLGFGIPCFVMSLSLIIFFIGTMTYQFTSIDKEKSPFVRIGRVFVTAISNRKMKTPAVSVEETTAILRQPYSQQFKFLNKALGRSCNVSEVEEAKGVLRLIPIWSSCLVFGIVFAQAFTFFTKQGVTMDRWLSSGFEVPDAALQSFINLSVVILIPMYDRVLTPIAGSLSGNPAGITMLQRIGVGIVSSTVCMAVAGTVERKLLERAQEYGLVDMPKETVPMSVCRLIPQYLLFGVAEVFTMVGLQEFFYDHLRSIGLALYLSIFGLGSFLSSFVIIIIERATKSRQMVLR
ncbi:hypothetical protein ABFS83_14G320200 [Erythranthe nasuta]